MFATVLAARAAEPKLINYLVPLALVALFAFPGIAGLLRGRIKPFRSDREYVRAAEPAAFWFHVAANIVIGCLFLAAILIRPRLGFLGFGAMFAYFMLNSLRTGKVKPSIHDRVYTRRDDPGTYWFHIVVEAVVAGAFIAAAIPWR
jgi:hypothetical protein